MTATVIADGFRTVFLLAAGLYLGLAFAVMRRYFRSPPRSALRRLHVIGVSGGTTLLVGGISGDVLGRYGEPIVWYGAPVGLLGILLITVALMSLYSAQSPPRPTGSRSTDHGPSGHVREELSGLGHPRVARSLPGLTLALVVIIPAMIGAAIIDSRRLDDRAAVEQTRRADLQRALIARRADFLDGCDRDVRRSRANARAWREAEKARRADGDIDVARVYDEVATELERLGAIACASEYPARFGAP